MLQRGKERNLTLKEITRTQYKGKCAISTPYLFNSTLPIEITYDQEQEFNGHRFRQNTQLKNNKVLSKPTTLWNDISNAILERINQVLRNLVRTFNIK